MGKLLLLLIAVPLLEVWLLLQVGDHIGFFATVGLVIVTAIIGGSLVRQQGLQTLGRVQQSLSRNELPAMEMMEGIIILLCGALLITPGFLTDTLGFLCLWPRLRRTAIQQLLDQGIIKATAGMRQGQYVHSKADSPFASASQQQDKATTRSQSSDQRHNKHGDVIEGEFRRDE